MKALKSRKIDSDGFTLVEIIVTIVAAGILGAIFINFMGTALTSSWNAVEITRDEAGTEALMEQIIAVYVENINSDESEIDAGPDDVLDTIFDTYNGRTIDGIDITAKYIEFDGSGNESPGGSDNLKIVLQASGLVSPAIAGRYSMTAILTTSRRDDDPIVIY